MVVFYGVIPVFFVTIQDGFCDDFAPEYTTCYFRTKEAMEGYVVTVEDYELVSYGQMPEDDADIPF